MRTPPPILLLIITLLITSQGCDQPTPQSPSHAQALTPTDATTTSSPPPQAPAPVLTPPVSSSLPSHAQALHPLTLLPLDDPLASELLLAMGCPGDALIPHGCARCAGDLKARPIHEGDTLGQPTLTQIVQGQLTAMSGEHALITYDGCSEPSSGEIDRVLLHRPTPQSPWKMIARYQYNGKELCYALKGPHAAIPLLCHRGQDAHCYDEMLIIPNLSRHTIEPPHPSSSPDHALALDQSHMPLHTFLDDECDKPLSEQERRSDAFPQKRITLQIVDLDEDGDDDAILTHASQTYHLIQGPSSLSLHPR